MSLLQRVEQAQRRVDTPDAAEPPAPPVAPAVALSPAQMSAREDALRVVRVALVAEVSSASHSLFDSPDAADLRSKVEGIVDRVIAAKGVAITRIERERLIEELIGEVGGLGPLEPLLADETITEIMVNGPSHVYIERAGKIERDRQRLPVRRARPADHRPDHHPARPPHRQVEPAGRRPPARRLARERGHRAPLARRPGHHRPEVPGPPDHRRRPDPVRDGHARDVRLPAGMRRGPPQHLRLGRDRLGQDDVPERPVVVHPRGRADPDDRGRRRAPAPAGRT